MVRFFTCSSRDRWAEYFSIPKAAFHAPFRILVENELPSKIEFKRPLSILLLCLHTTLSHKNGLLVPHLLILPLGYFLNQPHVGLAHFVALALTSTTSLHHCLLSYPHAGVCWPFFHSPSAHGLSITEKIFISFPFSIFLGPSSHKGAVSLAALSGRHF